MALSAASPFSAPRVSPRLSGSATTTRATRLPAVRPSHTTPEAWSDAARLKWVVGSSLGSHAPPMHPLHAALSVQPATPRLSAEEKNESELLLPPSALVNPHPPLVPFGRTSGSSQPMSSDLLTLTAPHRPPVSSLIDPRTRTGTPREQRRASDYTSGGGSMSARVHAATTAPSVSFHRKLVDAGQVVPSPRFLASQQELDQWLTEEHTLADLHAQIRALFSQSASSDLELSVLRRETNSYKDAAVERLASELDRTRQQLRLAEEDISILSGERKVAVKAATAARRLNETVETRAKTAESLAANLTAQARATADAHIKDAIEYDQLARAMTDAEAREKELHKKLEEARLALEGMVKEREEFRGRAEAATNETAKALETTRDATEQLERARGENASLVRQCADSHTEQARVTGVLEQVLREKRDALDRLDQMRARQAQTDERLEAVKIERAQGLKALILAQRECAETEEKARAKQAELESERAAAERRFAARTDELTATQAALESTKVTVTARESDRDVLSRDLSSVRSALAREESVSSELRDELRQQQVAVATRQAELNALVASLAERDTAIASLRASLAASEDAVTKKERELVEARDVMRLNSSSADTQLQELATTKQLVLDLRRHAQDVEQQLGTMKLVHSEATVAAREELAERLTDLTRERSRANDLVKRVEELDHLRTTLEERVDAQTKAEAQLREEASAREAEATEKLTRLEALYEDTCNSMTSYSSLQTDTHQALRDQLKEALAQAEATTAQLDSQKHDADQLQAEYERLVQSHRMLHSASTADHKRLQEAEAKITELTQANRQLQAQVTTDSAAPSPRHGAPAFSRPPVAPAPAVPSLTKRSSTSGSLAASIVQDAMEVSSVKQQNVALTSQLEEARDEIASLRAKAQKLYDTSDEWKRKYEEAKEQLDQQIRRTPSMSVPNGSLGHTLSASLLSGVPRHRHMSIDIAAGSGSGPSPAASPRNARLE